MPAYPAFALLLGCAMAQEGVWVRRGTVALSIVSGIAALACFSILFAVRHVPTPGDITAALSVHPNAYKLSLGHMEDLTIDSFAYLRMPLTLAAIGFLLGSVGAIRIKKVDSSFRSYLAAALMMVIFFQAARLAMIRFDPLLSSRDFARLILSSPPGEIILDHNYYWFSSVPFYTDRPVLLLNGRWQNLEYGSNAPNTPDVFIDDSRLKRMWFGSQRYYLIARADQLPRFDQLFGSNGFRIMNRTGVKVLLTNMQ
jgi:hypothetical protein